MVAKALHERFVYVLGHGARLQLAERRGVARWRPGAKRQEFLSFVEAARLALILPLQDRDGLKEAIRGRAQRDGSRERFCGLRRWWVVAVDDGRA